MRKVIDFLLIVSFIFSIHFSNCLAADNSERYTFISNFVDCLAKLKMAANYPIEKDASYELILERFRSQLTYLKQAKQVTQNNLASREPAIQIAAWYIDTNVTLLKDAAEKIIDVLSKALDKEVSPKEKLTDVSPYILQYNESWNNIYGANSYLMQAIKRPFKTINPNAKIPFLITKKERQRLVGYINSVFKEEIKKYEKLLTQKKKGIVKDIKLSIPSWTAISLRSLLSAQTYGDIDKIDLNSKG